MATDAGKRTLFSRIGPGRFKPKRRCGFLDLPGELRNQIYSHYFQEEQRCEIAANRDTFCFRTFPLGTTTADPNSPPAMYRTVPPRADPKTLRVSRPLGQYQRIHGPKTIWRRSFSALSLVRKQIHRETTPLMYQSTTFAFAAPKRMANFLHVVPRDLCSFITKLHLHYSTYGSPHNAADRRWQDKHVLSWDRACRTAAKQLVHLRELDVWIRVNCRPVMFDLREAWLSPLLWFRRLAVVGTHRATDNGIVVGDDVYHQPLTPKALRRVKVHVKTTWTNAWVRNRLGPLPTSVVVSVVRANIELHYLFGLAISRAILGARETEAMAEFRGALQGKYRRLRDFFTYC